MLKSEFSIHFIHQPRMALDILVAALLSCAFFQDPLSPSVKAEADRNNSKNVVGVMCLVFRHTSSKVKISRTACTLDLPIVKFAGLSSKQIVKIVLSYVTSWSSHSLRVEIIGKLHDII